jgi:hypothetical protein
MVASRALGRAEPILIWPWHGAQQFYADTVDPVSKPFCVLYITLLSKSLNYPSVHFYLFVNFCFFLFYVHFFALYIGASLYIFFSTIPCRTQIDNNILLTICCRVNL